MSAMSWDDLAYSVARHLESMPQDSYFILCVDDSGRPDFDEVIDDHPLYVQFCAYGGNMMRCEVVSNRYLPEDRQHSVDDLIELCADGWRLPADENINGSPNLFMDVPVTDVDTAAVLAMRVFRRTWKVGDPTELITDRAYLRGPHAFRVLDAPNGYAADEPAA